MRTTAIVLLVVTWSLVTADAARPGKEHDTAALDLVMVKLEKMEREVVALTEEVTQLQLAVKQRNVDQASYLSLVFTWNGAYYPRDCDDLQNIFNKIELPVPDGYFMVQANSSETSRKFVLC